MNSCFRTSLDHVTQLTGSQHGHHILQHSEPSNFVNQPTKDAIYSNRPDPSSFLLQSNKGSSKEERADRQGCFAFKHQGGKGGQGRQELKGGIHSIGNIRHVLQVLRSQAIWSSSRPIRERSNGPSHIIDGNWWQNWDNNWRRWNGRIGMRRGILHLKSCESGCTPICYAVIRACQTNYPLKSPSNFSDTQQPKDARGSLVLS